MLFELHPLKLLQFPPHRIQLLPALHQLHLFLFYNDLLLHYLVFEGAIGLFQMDRLIEDLLNSVLDVLDPLINGS